MELDKLKSLIQVRAVKSEGIVNVTVAVGHMVTIPINLGHYSSICRHHQKALRLEAVQVVLTRLLDVFVAASDIEDRRKFYCGVAHKLDAEEKEQLKKLIFPGQNIEVMQELVLELESKLDKLL